MAAHRTSSEPVRSRLRSFRSSCRNTVQRLRLDDRGEGVISAAIAVLIMAGIGALMWVGFKAIWEDTETNTKDKVAEIGD